MPRSSTDGEAPLAAAQAQLEQALQRARARSRASCRRREIASDELDALLRERDDARAAVGASASRRRARRSMMRGLAAQQVRVRRESVAEQFAATHFELAALLAQLAPEATVEAWESQLEETKGKIERLGQVNLAAIGEFKEQSERKEYLDRQCKDLTDALETLESAMRKIDRETRTRFQDTFDRVNAGPEGEISAPVRRRPRLSGADRRGRRRRPASRSWRGRPASATAPSASCRAARRR